MYGKQQIVIDWKTFASGMSPSAEIDNGGFSPESKNLNLIAQPGVLNATGEKIDKKANLTDEIIASAEDPTYSGDARVFLDDTGNLYTLDSSNDLTKEDSISSDKVTRGATDMVAWTNDADGLQFYITTKAGASGDVIQWNKSSTLDEDWWSGAGGLSQGALSATTAWRPLLVYEKDLYIGDRNKLHRAQSDGVTANNGILTLGGDKSISALGIDPSSGLMLIGMTTGDDANASRNGKSFIGIYDGYSNKLRKIVEISGTVTAFKSVDGFVYVFYGNKIGIWTGSSVRFLRSLDFAIGTLANIVYPHRATAIDNTLYFCGAPSEVWAYGEVIAGAGKVFYPVIDDGDSVISMVTNIGGNKLGYSYETATPAYFFYTIDTTSIAKVTTNNGDFYSVKYSFPRPATIRSIRVYYKTALATGTDAIGTIKLTDDVGTTTTVKSIVQIAGATQKYIETEDVGIKTAVLQLRYTFAPTTKTDVNGIEKIIIYYDFAE